jgi:hypothetical protein
MWLKCVTGVAPGARIFLFAWHGLHASAIGNRLSCGDVLSSGVDMAIGAMPLELQMQVVGKLLTRKRTAGQQKYRFGFSQIP